MYPSYFWFPICYKMTILKSVTTTNFSKFYFRIVSQIDLNCKKRTYHIKINIMYQFKTQKLPILPRDKKINKYIMMKKVWRTLDDKCGVFTQEATSKTRSKYGFLWVCRKKNHISNRFHYSVHYYAPILKCKWDWKPNNC